MNLIQLACERDGPIVFQFRFSLAAPMTLRSLLVVILALACGPALAAPAAVRRASPAAPTPPMVFYVAKGAPDACGRGCDRWIAVEGQVDGGAALRFRNFLTKVGNRGLPVYFSSPGGNLDQALAMGAMLREKPVVARVARTVVRECGFESQDGAPCLKLKASGRELHGDLWTRGAMCNSACPYLILGANTREIAPDAQLAIHSPKVVLHFTGGPPTEQMRAAATQRGIERADRMLSAYVARMGAQAGLLDLAKTVKFESMHVLTREEIVRFGIDRRELVETPWTFENNSRSMVRKFVVQKNDRENSYRLSQWRLICFNTDAFELDFQRPAIASANFASVSITNGGPKPLYFVSPPARLAGFEVWGLRMTRASIQSLADLPQFDFAETSFAADARRLAQPAKFSTEGLAAALASLTATCPPPKGTVQKDVLQMIPMQKDIAQKDMAPLQTDQPRDSAAK
jgi:hypothetical protein